MYFNVGDVVRIIKEDAPDYYPGQWLGRECVVVSDAGQDMVSVRPLFDRPDFKNDGPRWVRMGFGIKRHSIELAAPTPQTYEID